jgi:hypothetical protein
MRRWSHNDRVDVVVDGKGDSERSGNTLVLRAHASPPSVFSPDH